MKFSDYKKGDLVEIIADGHYDRLYYKGEIWKVVAPLVHCLQVIKVGETAEWNFTIVTAYVDGKIFFEAVPYNLYSYK